MAVDTKYVSKPFLFTSKGVVARPIIDRVPEGYYLSLLNCFEQEEGAMSSRFGSLILNRDSISANFFAFNQISTITRLKGLNSQTWRYYQSLTSLYRRAGNLAGQYNLIYTGLSGNAFSSLVAPTFASGIPYLFIYDSAVSIKDVGTGIPVRTGILPPTQVANAIAYAGDVTLIDTFSSTSGYTLSNIVLNTVGSVYAVNGVSGTPVLGTDYETYQCVDKSASLAQNYMLMFDQASNIRQIFQIEQNTSTFSINPLGLGLPPSTQRFGTIGLTSASGVAASTTATIGKTASFNFGAADPNDLIILAFLIENPDAVQEIRLQFDINNGGYTQSYYYRSITPPSYQSAVSTPQTTSPSDAVNDEIFARAGGVANLNQVNSTATQIIPTDDPSISQLQPSAMTSGSSSWTVALLPIGSFLPVGNAGSPGNDWSAITGWQIQIITNAEGSTGSITFNGLYFQGGAGPSSYGGLGYDYRYIYVNANTLTPSNPSGEQYFETTQSNPGATSTLIVLRQAIQVTGQYSSDPQVTHVWIYRRGGTLADNWQYLDKIPNIVGSAAFTYEDVIEDSTIEQTDLLGLANDAPVTSTLQNPIATTLSAPLSPTAPFMPIAVSVAQASAVFVPGQLVDVGNPANLEQVYVVAGGTGTFTACIQLTHASGEQVNVYSLPAVPCNLAALAYGQVWLAGDPNNPHLLYYSNPGYPENFGPQNYIAVSSPADPIMALITFRGALYVATLTTWYTIQPGAQPIAQPTGSKHGLVASFGWCQTESSIWYRAVDGIREFTGADGPYRSLDIEWVFQQGGNAQIQALSPIPFASSTNPSTDQMAFWNNQVFLTYLGQDGNYHRLSFHTIYRRWRDSTPDPTKFILGPALYTETDLNTLLYSEAVIGFPPAPTPPSPPAPGPEPTPIPPIPPGPVPYDMLAWMLMSPSLAASNHFKSTELDGVTPANHLYTQLGTGNFYWIKGDSGYPWDINIFDSNFIYLSTTELTYASPTEGKRFESLNPLIGFKGVPFAKRFMNIGDQVFSTDTRLAIYTACGSATYTNIGNVRCTLAGPFTETISGAGQNIPSNLTTIHIQYEWSLDASYNRKSGSVMETYTFCQPYGLVHWQTQNWDVGTGSYGSPTNATNYNILTAGAGPSYDDPCGFGVEG
jgi:hypothetical protein